MERALASENVDSSDSTYVIFIIAYINGSIKFRGKIIFFLFPRSIFPKRTFSAEKAFETPDRSISDFISITFAHVFRLAFWIIERTVPFIQMKLNIVYRSICIIIYLLYSHIRENGKILHFYSTHCCLLQYTTLSMYRFGKRNYETVDERGCG